MPKPAQEARKDLACPLCGRESYCYLIGNDLNKPDLVLCNWTEPNRPPKGWSYQGLSKDNRPKFLRDGSKQRRSRKYPELIRLQTKELEDSPQWSLEVPNPTLTPKDLITSGDGILPGIFEIKRRQKKKLLCSIPGGTQVTLEIAEKDAVPCVQDPKTGDQLHVIEYYYPDPLNPDKNLGKVVRRQWTDRRAWFESYTKTKEVRPWFWNEDAGDWSMGRGQRPWPLYRENEAKDAIIRGDVVFVVGGEQSVEAYRGLGLTATTCQGGEARYADIPTRLSGSWAMAQESGLRPLLVIHPDFDLTGDATFAGGLIRECRKEGLTAVVLNPLLIWPNMPHGGDIKDVVDDAPFTTNELLISLENAINEAIELTEVAERNIKRRRRWGAPDTVDGELGYYRKNDDYNSDEERSIFRPLTNFDLQIEKEVASSDGGGFILQLKRSGDHQQHRVFLSSLDFTSATKFEDALKRSLGGSLICRLNNHQMKALLRVRLDEYHSRGGKLYRLAERVGQQHDGYWIFPNNQLTPDGEVTNEDHSRWIWNDGITGQADTLPVPNYNPASSQVISELVESMAGFYGPVNIYPALLTLGYSAAAIHYQAFINQTGSFPILNLIGDGGGGKTTAGACALALSGMHTDKAGGMLKEVSVSAAYERLKLMGGLIHCWDDPQRTPELDEFLKGLYNGKPRLVRGGDAGKFNSQKPHSALMVASNFAAGEANAATMSRLILLWFDCRDKCAGKTAWTRMKQAMDQVSGALPQLIKLGLDLDGISQCEESLLPYLPHAHSRMARNLAIILHYGNAVLDLAGMRDQFDLLGYLKGKVCPMANDADASTDSLRDFIEKLSMLRSQGELGEWNMRFVREHRFLPIKYLSIRLNAVWDVVDKNAKLAYNKQIIKNLLTARGAIMQDRQRFHSNKVLSHAVDKGTTNDPKWKTARCVSIPIDIIREYIEIDEYSQSPDDLENLSTVSTNELNQGETIVDKGAGQLTTICQLNVNQEINSQLIDVGPEAIDKKECQPDLQVDKAVSTAQSHVQQGFEAILEGQLTGMTKKMPAYIFPAAPSQGNTNVLHEPLFSIGTIIIPTGATSWCRTGSSPLPKGAIPHKCRHDTQILMAHLNADGWHALQRPSKILAISKDKQRVKVRNQETGRTDVLTLKGLQILPNGPLDHPS